MIISESDQQLRIGDAVIPYTLRKGKKGRIRLAFKEDHTLLIDSGNRKLDDWEKNYLKQKSRWILRHYKAMLAAGNQAAGFKKKLDKDKILLLGDERNIRFEPDTKAAFNWLKEENTFLIKAPVMKWREKKLEIIYYCLKAFAANYLRHKTDHWAILTRSEFNALRIKELRSRWGSCSRLRNLNLNWQLIYLEETLIDYVVIHELMHLRVLDHSPKFWAEVETFYPAYKEANKKLKERQWLIGIMTDPAKRSGNSSNSKN